VVYEGIHCRLAVERPAAGVVVVRITGSDIGEFGEAPLRELQQYLDEGGPLALFIDAREAKGATVDVSSEWALWLRKHKDGLQHVSMLTGAPFIRLTARFVQRFADLGEAMRIYTDARAFDAALAASTQMRKMGSVPI
jgi:hypothetical protein